MYDRHTTRSRGFGFVTMDVRAVAAAVDDQARDKFCHQLDGKHFEVRPATPVGASPPPAPPGVGIVNRCVGIKILRRVDLRAIDATPARWRGGAVSSPLDGVSTPRHRAPDVLIDFHTGRDPSPVRTGTAARRARVHGRDDALAERRRRLDDLPVSRER